MTQHMCRLRSILQACKMHGGSSLAAHVHPEGKALLSSVAGDMTRKVVRSGGVVVLDVHPSGTMGVLGCFVLVLLQLRLSNHRTITALNSRAVNNRGILHAI